jgi:hypothetical protein
VIAFLAGIWCALTHGFWHVPLRRDGDTSIHACAYCETYWCAFRPAEAKRFARQASIDAFAVANSYDPGEWIATRSGGSLIGRGRTRWEAIRDLIDSEHVEELVERSW